ncbi:MAG: hypothetical protein U5K33_09985 [Halofilum sp. (in: g-proteobacteria)]|nr:hypothetical protein [Halofilum sp. (in: g-proteobacteria)]
MKYKGGEMNTLEKSTAIFVLALAATGCTTTQGENPMTKLEAEELNELVIGNTYSAEDSEGKWAEYYATDDSGYARAWGSWGQDDVKSSHVTHSDGTICHQYTGTCDWAGPEHKYCGSVYKDENGNYYYKVLTNTYSPWKEGNFIEMEIKPGDPYGLAE